MLHVEVNNCLWLHSEGQILLNRNKRSAAITGIFNVT